ncbi:TonB family protein [Verrucomicrobium sp. 3C]|uniref:TonB family protein n=1 Tax=Verrucomicrobium sp. 3C TaxID=1134055 RepID=UPI00039C6B31|nr:TonB family protein [Verrucomicrobium sp. 3C]
MTRDSISRQPSVPREQPSQARAFRRTYPLVAAGHLLALLLFLVLAKFVASRPPPAAFFSPVSVDKTGVGNYSPPQARSDSSPSPAESRTPSPAARAEPPTKPASSLSNPSRPPVKSVPSGPAMKKHGEPLRKPSIRPNLVEVSRTLPAEAAAAKPPPVTQRGVEPSAERSQSQTGPLGSGEGAGSSSSNSPSLGPNWYYALIRDRLYAAWDQPLHLSSQNLVAKVQIFVAKDGRISKPVLLNSSDNEEFDRTVLAAARQVETVGEPRPPGVAEAVTVTFRMVH